MSDQEWQEWSLANECLLEVIRAHLLCETQRHAGTLGSLMQPRKAALDYLDAEYPNDPPGFHERLADDLIANHKTIGQSVLAVAYVAAWSIQDQERIARGEPCPCHPCSPRPKRRK